MKLKAVIIEDEEDSRTLLTQLLLKYCRNITIVGSFATVAEAVEPITNLRPDIVFLDIELPAESGFALFDYISTPTFAVIFTTAYNEFALRAFKLSAVEYLLKPIDIAELQDAILKVQTQLEQKANLDVIGLLKSNMRSQQKRMAISHSEGYDLLDIDGIIWLSADSNYTCVYLQGGRKITITKTLKNLEEILEKSMFFRINRSAVVNINCVMQFKKSDNSIVLSDGTGMFISESRRDAFLSHYTRI